MGPQIPKLSPIVDEVTLSALADAVAQKRASSGGSTTEVIVRWAVMLVMSALLSYFTTIGTMSQAIAEVRTTEEAHFQELLRRLDVMQADIRELRNQR
ncbi:MAG TPA: hypothetical protein VEA16_15270 [Vicinamibacterales bacterium]|nr:hypothetical protein [Vicinamibacterales bacterium]